MNDLFLYILRIVFAVGIIVAALFLFRLFLNSIFFPKKLNSSSGFSSVILRIPLAPSKFLTIVELGEELLILGLSENNITLLAHIKDKEEVRRLKTEIKRYTEVEQKPMSFQPLSFLKNLEEKLRRLRQ